MDVGVGWVKEIQNSLPEAVTPLLRNAKNIKGLNPACKQVGGVVENLL